LEGSFGGWKIGESREKVSEGVLGGGNEVLVKDEMGYNDVVIKVIIF
jgi:hypothetical protein